MKLSLRQLGMGLMILSLFLDFSCKMADGPVDPRPMELLFLGHDSPHHDARAYAPMLQASLAPVGIYINYTSDPADLNADNLAQYDGLILYANHDEITPSQADALLNFVKDGGAFIPIHSASYCFRNNEEVVDLIGGQFSSHDTATFTSEIILPEHPAMSGVETFSSWDETYVHTLHSKDKTVLMERVEGDHREPYTWVKTYGKGRVFYTALGHDERTWSHPAFHKLLEQGIRWALGEARAEALARLELPERTYSPAKIPNYEERDPPPMLQAPFAAKASMQRIQIPQGFRLELFAEEPMVINPICMAWDERGRLWVVETKDYPNEINKTLGEGSDRIKILEDTDGDGRADTSIIFAENLSVPTSMVFARGGVIVSQAPYFLFLQDTTGDDRADLMEVIMEGWGTFDTHAGPSNLTYGFDNMIWGVLGYSGFEGTVGDVDHEFRQGAYRFTNDGNHLEFMGATSNNTWGLGFSEDFDVFISTANNTHSAYLGIPDRYLQEVEGLKVKSVKKIDGHYAFHPNTPNYRQVDVFGGFTAAAGHHLYTARDFPMEYWNRIAFVCEPTGHLLHRAILERQGAGYVEKDGWNMLASSDEWVSPVHAEVGPDGALWVLDWYNFIIQHNPTPTGFENGAGNAHVNPLRDRQHGRIYRIVHDDAREEAYPDLANQEGRLAALSHDNLLWRLHAQRLLVEGGDAGVESEVINLLADQSVDAVGISAGAIHALWTLHGLELIRPENKQVWEAVANALQHPAASVRKNAVRVLPAGEESLKLLQRTGVMDDADAGTLLQAILHTVQLPASDLTGTWLYQWSQKPMVQGDEWLSRAVYAGAVKHKETFIKALYAAESERVATGYQDNTVVVDWSAEDQDVSDWLPIQTPMRWNKTGVPVLKDFDGILWTSTQFKLSASQAGKRGRLYLGPVDDSDETYLNGKIIGTTNRAWNDPRIYTIPAGLLREGTNRLTVRISDSGGRGGIYGEAESVYMEVGGTQVPLAGTWSYKIEEQFFPNRSVFEEGMSITDIFLKHYGPYASQLAASLPEPPPADQVIQLKTVPDQMRYDQEELSVVAGETVRFVFSNNDGMQHNFLIGLPGSLETIGKAADEMAQQPDGAAQGYIPPVSQVLVALGLVDPGQTREVVWTVPEKPGQYVFVCTFPGHWRTMNGVINVTAPNL